MSITYCVEKDIAPTGTTGTTGTAATALRSRPVRKVADKPRCVAIHAEAVDRLNASLPDGGASFTESQWQAVERFEWDIQAAIDAGDVAATTRLCGEYVTRRGIRTYVDLLRVLP